MSHVMDVNCNSDFRFQVDIQTPNAAGDLAQPAAGQITGVTVRLSATATGAAIHVDVGALATAEASGKAGRFYVVVDRALLLAHILPLGVGARFYAIWSRTGDMDMEAIEYRVADHRVQAS